jgi:hypothetical protein
MDQARVNDQNCASVAQQQATDSTPSLDSESLIPVSLAVVFQRRPENDGSEHGVTFSGYDILWPDGRVVTLGLHRFCNQGTRLLLGRDRSHERVLVRVTLYPISGIEASLTRPGRGIRCRRFFAVRHEGEIRFYFLTGDRTEIVFDEQDDPRVLHWLHAKHIRAQVPFWFDIASELLPEGGAQGRVPEESEREATVLVT